MTLTPSLKQLALDSLSSGTCPHCGGLKRVRDSFCLRCYRALPASLRNGLYKTFGNGYEQEWDACRTWLQAESNIPIKGAVSE